MTNRYALPYLLTGVLLLATRGTSAATTVVELFTSQSCSSCPPADALLVELAGRPDMLALSLHVDYWNRLGWRDPYASPVFTRRQRTYADLLADHNIYTPELVVSGRIGVVGSDRAAVEAALASAAADTHVDVRLHQAGTALVADIAGGYGPATLWLAGFDPHHATAIGGGENVGRTLIESDVVRSLAPVATWSGAALHVDLPQPAGQQAAVFLQAADGRILGAATFRASR